jgi:hypothetical protein
MEERKRRSLKDRRLGVDRRKFDDPNYKGVNVEVGEIGDQEWKGENRLKNGQITKR